MVALKRQQTKRSKWHIAHLTAAFAVVLGFFLFLRLATLTNCDHDVTMEIANQSLLNGRKYTPSLASRQSYGFFDDIQDDSWKIMQERARSSINYANRENPEKFNKNAMYWLMSNLMVRSRLMSSCRIITKSTLSRNGPLTLLASSFCFPYVARFHLPSQESCQAIRRRPELHLRPSSATKTKGLLNLFDWLGGRL
jgi:hypothetical protein